MSAYKCVVWGTALDYEMYFSALKYQELLGYIEVVGVTSNLPIYERLDGYRFISKTQLLNVEFDLLIIASVEKFSEIRQEATSLGIEVEKIMNIKVFALPEFLIDKYKSLKHSNITLFSNNCWGGITYNRLGLEFLSPFINMFVSAPDYLKIMNAPKQYLSHDLILSRYNYEPSLNRNYPVCYLDDAEVHFNHYESLDEAVAKWNSRRIKINWDNLFVMMYTIDPKEAEMFAELPYRNKVCFVPFESSEPSLMSIPYNRIAESRSVPFWAIVNGLALGMYKYYDVLDLLHGNLNHKRVALRNQEIQP